MIANIALPTFLPHSLATLIGIFVIAAIEGWFIRRFLGLTFAKLEGRAYAGMHRRTFLIFMVSSFCASLAKRVDSVNNGLKVIASNHGRFLRTGLATMNALTTLQLSLRVLVRAAPVLFVLLHARPTFTVSNTADVGDPRTLRYAITQANLDATTPGVINLAKVVLQHA